MKTHEMFSVHTTPKAFKNASITGHFGFVFGKKKSRAGKSPCFRDVIVFKKLRFQKVFSVHAKTKSRRFQILPV